MQIKKYKAASLQKAIEQVRTELGDGAIILQADPIKSGPFGKSGVEVTAALDRNDGPPRFRMKLEDEDAERSLVTSQSEESEQNKMKFGWNKLFGASKKKKEKQETKPVAKPEASEVKEAVQKKLSEASRTKTNLNESSVGQMYAVKSLVDPLQKELEGLKKSFKESLSQEKNQRLPSSAYLESEIQGLKKTLHSYITERKFEGTELPPYLKALHSYWQEHGMTEAQIWSFFSQFESHGVDLKSYTNENKYVSVLENRIREADTLSNPAQKIVVLVGPTGVGKTTTIAKLAAFEKLKLGRSVGFITIDDFKIGGTDQISHYARILDVPFIKSRSDVSLEEQCDLLGTDTIFIDTFGASPKDEEKISSLRKILRFQNPNLASRVEVHLALPASINSRDVDLYIDSYSRLKPNFLIFTKWDETDNWGGMLATILSSGRPVSFVGHGQEVPDDLSVFSSSSFVHTVTNVEDLGGYHGSGV